MKINPGELQTLASVFSVAIADTEEGGAQWEAIRSLVGDVAGFLEGHIKLGEFDRQEFLDDAGCYDLDDDEPGLNE